MKDLARPFKDTLAKFCTVPSNLIQKRNKTKSQRIKIDLTIKTHESLLKSYTKCTYDDWKRIVGALLALGHTIGDLKSSMPNGDKYHMTPKFNSYMMILVKQMNRTIGANQSIKILKSKFTDPIIIIIK